MRALVVKGLGTSVVSVACLLLLACSSQKGQDLSGGTGGSGGWDGGSPVDANACTNCGIAGHTLTRQSPPSDCTFNLDTAPPVPNNVRVMGTVDTIYMGIPQGDPDGWVYEPGSMAITLEGSSCRKVRDGTITGLQMLFGCPSCPIP